MVIPTFNRSVLLQKAIQSVLKQTYPVHEILVCDDGSTDNSKEAVSQLKNEKVKWIDCGKNGRPAIPRNIGIKKSTGNWIAFLDSDDEWLPPKIEEQVKMLKESKGMACATNAYRVKPDGERQLYLEYSEDQISITKLLRVNNIVCSSVLIKKDLLENTSLFPEEKKMKAIEDYALWMRIATKSNFHICKEPLVNYRDDAQNSIRSDNSWEVLKIVFKDFKSWINVNRVNLTEENRILLKEVMKWVRYKGETPPLQRFKERVETRLRIIFNKEKHA